MKSIRRKSRFEYNVLEQRQLLAGDVSVYENGELFIRGDEHSNQIEIVADDSGEILITGLHGTTINGSTDAFEVENVTNLHGVHGRNAAFGGGLRIVMYEGHDRIDVRGVVLEGQSFVSTGEGDDFFRFHKSTSQHELTMLTGDGDDTLRFFQTRAMGDFTAMTGEGQDKVMVWNSRLWRDTTLVTGAEDDSVTAAYVHFSGDAQQILTEGGDDRVELIRNNVGSTGLSVHTGAEHDRVIAEMTENNEILGMIEVDGQSGMDVLDMGDVSGNSNMLTADDFENEGGIVVLENTGDIDLARGVGNLGENDPRRAAIRAQFDDTTMVTSVAWAGTYDLNDIATQDIFVIEIYEGAEFDPRWEGDVNVSPVGSPIASFTVGDNDGAEVTRINTGKTLADPGSPIATPRNIFSFEADIAYQMEAGKDYWVSIRTLESGQPGDEYTTFQMGVLYSGSGIDSAYFQGHYDNSGQYVTAWSASRVRGWHMTLRS
jgi:hypothetical protein